MLDCNYQVKQHFLLGERNAPSPEVGLESTLNSSTGFKVVAITGTMVGIRHKSESYRFNLSTLNVFKSSLIIIIFLYSMEQIVQHYKYITQH